MMADLNNTKGELLERIAELENTVRALRQDLIHDSLTGLKTRAFFEEEARMYQNSAQNDYQGQRKEWFGFRNLSFIFFDIDHFKNINDTYGHDVGDAVLRTVAKRIEDGVREGDIAARWGGEEMVVALLGATEKAAEKKAESIRKSVERLSFNEVEGLNVTVSAGVSALEPDITFEEMLKRADEAMYKAKQSGRNRVIPYSEIREEGLS